MSSLRPSRPSEPPPPDSDPGPSSGTGPLPMPVFAAFLWGMAAVLLSELVRAFVPAPDQLTFEGCRAVGYLLVLFGILRVHEPESSIRAVVGLRRTNLAFLPLAIGIGVVANPPLTKLYELLSERFPKPPAEETSMLQVWTELSAGGRIRYGLALILLGPILEEILCRGALFSPLVKRYDRLTAALVTSSVFALLHRWDLPLLLSILVFALFLALLRSESGSLVPPILAHVTFNLVTIVELQRMAIERPVRWLTHPDRRTVVLFSLGLVALGLLVRIVGERSDAARLAQSDDERRGRA
jgi:membrane protease YdiL (CAAX protease family)